MFKKLLLFSFIFFCCATIVKGAQEIKVFQDREENATVAEIADLALEKGFLQAVFQTAQKILPEDLEHDRQEVLKDFLGEHIEDLILSYARQEKESREEVFFLALQVSVDQKELKELLKKWGTYYTSHQVGKYQLHPEGFVFQDWEDLEKLQSLSGMVQEENSTPRLFLRRKEENVWKGRLEYAENSWSYEGSELKETWLELWSNYFSLPQVRQDVTEMLILKLSGWVSTEGVQAFDRILDSWDAQIDSYDLLYTHIGPQKISAAWQVSTLDKARLEQKLKAFVAKRGLSFSL